MIVTVVATAVPLLLFAPLAAATLLPPTPPVRNFGGCSDNGCFLIVNGRALMMGRLSVTDATLAASGSHIGGLLMTLTTVGTDEAEEEEWNESTTDSCAPDVGDDLPGLGGNAGRSMDDGGAAELDTIGVCVVTLVGATMCTLGLCAMILGGVTMVVGATLLIGLRGGTAKLPGCSLCSIAEVTVEEEDEEADTGALGRMAGFVCCVIAGT